MQSSISLRENAVPELHVHKPLLKHFACYSHKKITAHKNIMKWN